MDNCVHSDRMAIACFDLYAMGKRKKKTSSNLLLVMRTITQSYKHARSSSSHMLKL